MTDINNNRAQVSHTNSHNKMISKSNSLNIPNREEPSNLPTTKIVSRQQSELDIPIITENNIKNDDNSTDTHSNSYQEAYPENDSYVDWSFDIFKYEIKFGANTMTEVGAKILIQEYNIGATLKIDNSDIVYWLTQIEDRYHYDLPYHNCIHGADALQATASLLTQLNSCRPNFLTRFQQVALLIAATAHDVGHPGKTAGYLRQGCSENIIFQYMHTYGFLLRISF